eukprot:scaffold227401_cov18-Tisochrysis_lutea.AAC.1
MSRRDDAVSLVPDALACLRGPLLEKEAGPAHAHAAQFQDVQASNIMLKQPNRIIFMYHMCVCVPASTRYICIGNRCTMPEHRSSLLVRTGCIDAHLNFVSSWILVERPELGIGSGRAPLPPSSPTCHAATNSHWRPQQQ